jgi:hypothetical protein
MWRATFIRMDMRLYAEHVGGREPRHAEVVRYLVEEAGVLDVNLNSQSVSTCIEMTKSCASLVV